jgi:hypothetical protein
MTDLSAHQAFSDTSSSTLVGRFTYIPATEEWWWSDGMYRIHGFEPGEVQPTTALVRRHVHPDDLDAAQASRDVVLERQEPFTFPHRILTATEQVRVVIAAGHVHVEDGEPVISGHYVDVTDFRQDAVNIEVGQAVQDFAEHRAVIEQAKGVLMQLYSVEADMAWSLLRAFSSDTNRKVRDIAEVLVEAASEDRTPAKPRSVTSAHDMMESLYRADGSK